MQDWTDSASSGPAPSAPQNQQDDAKRATGPLGGIILLAGLLWLSYLIIQNFVVPLVWAGILVYVSWPLHQRLRRRLGRRDNLSALLTTALLSTAIVNPVLGLSTVLGDELGDAYRQLQGRLAAGPVTLPPAIAELPWLGERLQRLVERLATDPTWVRGWLGDQAPNWLQEARQVMATIGRNLFKLGITVGTVLPLSRWRKPAPPDTPDSSAFSRITCRRLLVGGHGNDPGGRVWPGADGVGTGHIGRTGLLGRRRRNRGVVGNPDRPLGIDSVWCPRWSGARLDCGCLQAAKSFPAPDFCSGARWWSALSTTSFAPWPSAARPGSPSSWCCSAYWEVWGRSVS